MTDDTIEKASEEAPLTQEQRLRALTSDRKRKARPGAKSAAADGPRPGDLVDAVRERSNGDMGRDTPL